MWHRLRTPPLRGELITGVLLSACLAGAAWLVNETYFGAQFALFTYRLLQGQLHAPDRLPVVIIDISELPPNKNGVTPRRPLRMLLTALSNMEPRSAPRVIGVDIDMSPEVDGNGNLVKFVDAEDPALFDFCEVPPPGSPDAGKHMRVTTLFGVFRTQALPPDRWLGFPQYENLAASLWLHEREEAAPASFSPGDADAQALTFGAALAHAYEAPRQRSNWVIRSLKAFEGFFVTQYTTAEITPRLRVKESLIDFSVVDRLRQDRIVLPHKAYDSLADLEAYLDLKKEDISGRMVILGDVSHAQSAEDIFADPAHGGILPGVLIHAAAAFTQAERPLYVVRESIRPLIDFFVALAGLSFETMMIATFGHRIHHRRLEWVVTIVSVSLILLFGWFINFTHVLWDDFLFVAIVTAIHPACHHAWEHGWETFTRWLPPKQSEA